MSEYARLECPRDIRRIRRADWDIPIVRKFQKEEKLHNFITKYIDVYKQPDSGLRVKSCINLLITKINTGSSILFSSTTVDIDSGILPLPSPNDFPQYQCIKQFRGDQNQLFFYVRKS